MSQGRSRLRQLGYRLENHLLIAATSRQIRETAVRGAATYEALHPHFALPVSAAALYVALADTVYARWVTLGVPVDEHADRPRTWPSAEEIVAGIDSVEDARRVAEYLEISLTITS
ncbi:hypothetical protein [Actinomycetospora sp. TBRC 11914]|uniref:hypothetical protein n=1 Tax=Actinomycetospora sp. TBRC 11914 TaxID=2729387 RepID=UPI00145CCB7F|nr:hypothetical protein [Actinomycetospora sp. TBRC 11914]NMO91685.1 hypothetical protein [Actinomycetospora sp. TBRC 11914]